MPAASLAITRRSLFVLVALATTFSGFSAASAESPSKPNIVVILVDDMGYGDLGCYNPKSKIPTSNLNSIATAGMRFTDAHAPGPLCHLSRYGLMTGRYPFRTNVGVWPKHAVIKAERTTVPSMLKSVGYRTAMVGKWHLGFEENGYENPLPGGPVDRGFESYFGIRASTDIPPYFYIRGDRAVEPPSNRIAANQSEGWSPIQGAFWRAGGIAPNLALKDVLPKFTDEAVQVIESHGEKTKQDKKPLFLYLAYPAPHTPWLPSAEFRGKSGASMYGDFTMMVDAMIGRVLRALEKAQLSDDTLLIVTSDNGPVWYEADVERLGHDSSGGLRGMKSDAWECGHRMPFLVRWPGRVAPGTVSNQLVCFTDLMATFASIVGRPLGKDDGPDSFDFSTELTGAKRTGPRRTSLVMRSGGGLMTVRQGDWKLIQGLGSGGFSKPRRIKPGPGDPKGQLYNLKEDQAETQNRYGEQPDRVKQLAEELTRIVRDGRSR